MRSRSLAGLSLLLVACTFPEVDTTGLETGSTTSTSSTSSSPSSTSSTGETTTTSGGGASTSSTSTGDGGANTGGGDVGGAGGAGGAPPIGEGVCPPGSVNAASEDIEGCPYRTVDGEAGGGGGVPPEEGDCDGDSVPNGEDRCQPCDPRVPWDAPPDAFTDESYDDLDGEPSWDWNCDNSDTPECVVNDGGCGILIGGECATCVYLAPPTACGQESISAEFCDGLCMGDAELVPVRCH